MEDFQGGDLFACKSIFQMINFGKVINSKKRPKLDIQLPNTGDDNQICHILTVIFNRI